MIDKSKSGYIAERPRIGAGALVSSLARYPSRRCFSSVLLGGSLRRLDALGRAFGRLLGVVASRCGALSIGSSLIGSGRGGIFGTFSALVDALGYGMPSAPSPSPSAVSSSSTMGLPSASTAVTPVPSVEVSVLE